MVYLIKKLIFGKKKKEKRKEATTGGHIWLLGKVANTSLRGCLVV